MKSLLTLGLCDFSFSFPPSFYVGFSPYFCYVSLENMGALRYTINACNVLHDTGVIMFTTDVLVCGFFIK